MKIIVQKPPIWEEANKAFKILPNTVFTYGETIYNPDNAHMPSDLLIHEETHSNQQEHNDTVAKLWWMKYLDDPVFRLSQEVEAYHNQYVYFCTIVTDRNKQYKKLWELATVLASPLYNCNITTSEALKRIKEVDKSVVDNRKKC